MLRRRGRLLGTVARTAVVAGTATATASAVNRHRRTRQPRRRPPPSRRRPSRHRRPRRSRCTRPRHPPAPPPAASAEGDDLVGRIQQLAGLRDAGVLSEDEFAAAKGKLLGM